MAQGCQKLPCLWWWGVHELRREGGGKQEGGMRGGAACLQALGSQESCRMVPQMHVQELWSEVGREAPLNPSL